jgi:glycosyltransferase involved in cell wall biosynthesis
MKVLFLTTEWPTNDRPNDVPFLVQYVAALRHQGVEIEVFHFIGHGNPLNYFHAWFKLRKHPSWKQVDILHAHWGQSAVPAIFSRKPLIITYHGSDLQGIVGESGSYSLKGRLLVAVNKILARKADQCVVVSRRLAEFLPPSCSPIEVIPMGIDLNLFKPMPKAEARRMLGLDQDIRYVLFVTDPNRPEKRFYLAQQAVSRVGLHIVKLLVVSGQPHEKIPIFLNAGDLLLLTSSHEGSPVIIKEALACNLPVVSVNVGDVREQLENISGCVICEDDSVDTISNAIKKALAYPYPIDGRESVRALSWDLIAKRTISLYQNCLEE